MSAAQAAAGLVCALALVAIAAGAGKLRRPGRLASALGSLLGSRAPSPGERRAVLAVRALALGELASGALALALPLRAGAALMAGLYACFAAGALALGRAGWSESCGCFGGEAGAAGAESASASAGGARAALDLLASLAALVAVALGGAAPAATLARHPGAALAALIAGCALALLAQAGRSSPAAGASAAGSGAGALGERLAASSAALLERRLSRRTALQRIALAGSALCTAPLRYLLYPGTALAVVVPGSCSEGDCTDGYTAFCCEINKGLNQCPTGTFPGGWWMCTDYPGHMLCRGSGVRYYVDCNALPSSPFPGGCRCAKSSCNHRRVNCNVFRYGQCNTHIGSVTPVVCRMVTCRNPSEIDGLGCGDSLAVDNAVCGHDAPCLEPLAVELQGAGGV